MCIQYHTVFIFYFYSAIVFVKTIYNFVTDLLFNQTNYTMANVKVNIRYTANAERIKCKLPEHFAGIETTLRIKGGVFDRKPLLTAMGITGKRFNALLLHNEPTIGELARYAEFFAIPVTKLFTLIPFTTKTKTK